jgi:hypothetical protein
MIGTGSQGGAAAPRAGRGWLLLALALYLPFLGRSWQVDDGVLMRHARTVAQTPLDPYRDHFDAIGLKWPSRYNTHPPLLWYYLAPAAALPPELQRPGAHLLYLPFLLLLFPALRWLGRWGPERNGRAFLLTSPLLVVQAHCIAWEFPILVCGLLALGLMARGAETGSRAIFLASAVPAAVALLTAYPGRIVLLMPVLGFLLGAPWRWTFGAVALSLVPLGLYELGTAVAWGRCHLMLALTNPMAAFSYEVLRKPWLPGLANMLALLGGPGLAAPLLGLVRRRPRLAGAALLAGAAVAWLSPLPGPGARVQMAVWCGLGALALGLVAAESLDAARQALRRGARSAGAAAFWAAGFWIEAAFCVFGVVHGSARYVLPLVAPLAYFVGREWSRHALGRRAFAAAIAGNVAFALALSVADLEEVNAYARAPQRLDALPRPEGRSFYIGAWGFQAAMDEAGHLYLHTSERLRPGDRIVRARKLTVELGLWNDRLLDGVEPVLSEVLVLPSRWPLRLNDPDSGAGFWWSGAGLLPVGFTRGPIDELEVYALRPLPPLLRAVTRLAREPEAERLAPRPHLVLARFGDGVPRAAIFLHPPAAIELDLGAGSGTLRLEAGIHPDAGPGDGAVARVGLEGRELMRLSASQDRWASAQAELAVAAGGGALVLAADAGPAGDPSYDWLCVRIALEGPQAPAVLGARWTPVQGPLLE